MAELQPANYTANACHTAQGDRLEWSSIICVEGVSDKAAGDLLVTAGGSGLTVDVASGSAFIDGDNISDQGMYHAANLGTVNLALAAADPTDGRVDLVCATVRDSAYSGTDDDWILQVITGLPSPAPVVPGAPNNSIPLASVLVPAGATGGGSLTITDTRPQALICESMTPTETGAWTTYFPTWKSANNVASVGNGALVGRYRMLDEKTCVAHIVWTRGSTTNVGVGAYSWELPFTPAATTWPTGSAAYGGTATHAAGLRTLSAVSARGLYGAKDVFVADVDGAISNTNTPTASGWAVDDQISITVTYEVA